MAFQLILIIAAGGKLVKLKVHMSGCAFSAKQYMAFKIAQGGLMFYFPSETNCGY